MIADVINNFKGDPNPAPANTPGPIELKTVARREETPARRESSALAQLSRLGYREHIDLAGDLINGAQLRHFHS